MAKKETPLLQIYLEQILSQPDWAGFFVLGRKIK
jgi:hypothetical protein